MCKRHAYTDCKKKNVERYSKSLLSTEYNYYEIPLTSIRLASMDLKKDSYSIGSYIN